jgi:hypothetical protein
MLKFLIFYELNAVFCTEYAITYEEIIWLKKRLVRFLIPEIFECPLLQQHTVDLIIILMLVILTVPMHLVTCRGTKVEFVLICNSFCVS